MATWKLNGSTFWIWKEQENPKQTYIIYFIHCRQRADCKLVTDRLSGVFKVCQHSAIVRRLFVTLAPHWSCSTWLSILKKPDNPPLSYDWVFSARYWQRSMKECRQFCHFFKHQAALFHIWRMPLFSSFLKALDKTNTLRPFDRWEIESEPRASLEPTFPISGWS